MMRSSRATGALLIVLSGAGLARADALIARDDALTPARGSWQTGVFNPARYALADDKEIQLHPLLFFIAPHVELHVRHARAGIWQLTGLYGVSMPSLAMRLASGYLFPSFERGGGTLGWHVVPSVGVLASAGNPQRNVLTIKADATLGVPLVATDARPMQAPAPLEMLLTPVLTGYRLRVGMLYDARIRDWLRGRVYGDAFIHGIDYSNSTSDHLAHFTFRAGGGLDLRTSAHTRLTLGLVIWNSYQHAVDQDGRPRRSTDPLPVADFIWAY